MHIVQLQSLGVPAEVTKPYIDKLEAAGHSFNAYESTAPGDLNTRMGSAGAILVADMALTTESVQHAADLKFIDVAFTGVDKIPVDVCKSRGIAVSNASGYATQSVAELCIGVMIDLLRDIPQAQEHCRSGQTRAGLRANELCGKTVGIVGAGHIGLKVASLCKAFGCHVIAYNHHEISDPAIDEQVSLDELLTKSDIVSIHLGLYPDTRGLIGKEQLASMRPAAYLVNAARGPIVDQNALAEALCAGTIAGAALDVFDSEPPLSQNAPILQAPHVIATPHLGFYTEESLALRAKIAFENLFAWLDGKQQNVIVP